MLRDFIFQIWNNVPRVCNREFLFLGRYRYRQDQCIYMNYTYEFSSANFIN
jgi:hypothetical protein